MLFRVLTDGRLQETNQTIREFTPVAIVYGRKAMSKKASVPDSDGIDQLRATLPPNQTGWMAQISK